MSQWKVVLVVNGEHTDVVAGLYQELAWSIADKLFDALLEEMGTRVSVWAETQ